jgi:hypothetical protein
MMNFFSKNLELLNARLPKIAKHLKAPTHLKPLLTKSGDFTARHKGVLLHSAYSPKREAERLISKVDFKRFDTILVFGLGLGYHVMEILKRATPDTYILVVEPDLSLLSICMTLQDITPLLSSGRVDVAFGESEEGVIEKLGKNFEVLRRRGVKVVEHPPSVQLNSAYFGRLRKEVEHFINSQLIQSLTLAKFGEAWQRNLLFNIPSIGRSPGVAALFDKFIGSPAIIISAGPSLDKNIEHLSHAKGRALLISTDTALRRVILSGTTPELVVAIDPQRENLRRFENLDLEGVYLVGGTVAYWEIFELPIRKFVFVTNHPLCKWLSDKFELTGELRTDGGSVSTVAFDLARRMGCNPIIFVGQDLAFTDGFTHTKGLLEDLLSEVEINKFYTLEMLLREQVMREDAPKVLDIHGRIVPTNRVMLSYLRWFEDEISKSKNTLFIDATEGGAKIKGTQALPLQDALRKHCKKKIPFGEILSGCYTERECDFKPILEEMKALRKRLQRVKWLASEAKEGDGRRKEKVEEDLMGERSTLALLEVLFYSEVFHKLEEVKREEYSEENIRKRNFVWYSGVERVAEVMISLLDEAAKKIQLCNSSSKNP